MKHNKSQQAFTLIELLVVIAIIGILAALIMPAMSRAIMRARITKTRTEVTNILTAWNMYYREYGLWPDGYGDGENLLNEDVRRILSGTEPSPTYNRRNLPFMEFPRGEYLDHWGNEYRFVLDHDYNNRVTPQGREPLDREVAVWSLGPDGVNNTDDDITSW